MFCQWQTIMRPTLGILNGAFHQAFLAKQGWRILQNPSSLVCHVLKAKYFPDSSFFDAKVGHNASYIWCNFMCGQDLLLKRLRWRVGNGNDITAFQSPWIPRPYSFRSVTVNLEFTCDWRFLDYIKEGIWDVEALNSIFWPINIVENLRIPLGHN